MFRQGSGFTVRLGTSKVRKKLRRFLFTNCDGSWHLNQGKTKVLSSQEGVCWCQNFLCIQRSEYTVNRFVFTTVVNLYTSFCTRIVHNLVMTYIMLRRDLISMEFATCYFSWCLYYFVVEKNGFSMIGRVFSPFFE